MKHTEITRRGFLAWSGLALGTALKRSAGAASESGQTRPNIVFLMADDMGFERVGLYGGKGCHTPNLDRMASEGVRFDYCYAAPICTPTRVMLMTGKFNHRNYTFFSQYPKGQRCFAQDFRDAGYATAIIDKWQLGGVTPKELGFDEYCLFNYGKYGSPGAAERYWHPAIGANDQTVETTESDYGPDIFLKRCQDFVRGNKDRPFLLYWALGAPHAPYAPTPESDDPKAKPDLRYYPDIVSRLDKNVGELIATVDELGLARNTLILFAGDNGTPHGVKTEMPDGRAIEGRKGSMADAGTHVPFIARWKGVIPPGTVRDDLMTLCDLYPTFAEAAGIDVGQRRLDGASQLSAMKGQAKPARDWAFMSYKSQWPGPNGKHNVAAWVKDHRWKLYDAGKIFDLQNDPDEKTPAATPEAEEAKRRLQPIIARMGATPEAMKTFRDTNVRVRPKGRKGENGDD